MNTELLALSHETTICNFKKILSSRYLETPGTTLQDQFPGIYFNLIMASTEYKIKFSEIALIFPINLIYEQKNWHYNLIDHNGLMTYDTYFHNNLQDIPQGCKVIERVKYFPGNEVVFHDALPTSLISFVVCKNKNVFDELNIYIKNNVNDISKYIKEFSYKFKVVLGDKYDFKQRVTSINTDDMDKTILPIPFYLSDDLYTGAEFKFYNKPTISRTTSQYFKKMILDRLSKDEKKDLEIYLDDTKLINQLVLDEKLSEDDKKRFITYLNKDDNKLDVKVLIDKWIIDSKVIEKYKANPELRQNLEYNKKYIISNKT